MEVCVAFPGRERRSMLTTLQVSILFLFFPFFPFPLLFLFLPLLYSLLIVKYLICRQEYGTVYVSSEVCNKTNTCELITQLKKQNITNIAGTFLFDFHSPVSPLGIKIFKFLFWFYLLFPSFSFMYFPSCMHFKNILFSFAYFLAIEMEPHIYILICFS